MESPFDKKSLTVQGGDTPVPVSLEREKVNSKASSSSDCRALEDNHPASPASNNMGVNQEKQVAEAFALHWKEVKALVHFVFPRINVHKKIKILAWAASRTQTMLSYATLARPMPYRLLSVMMGDARPPLSFAKILPITRGNVNRLLRHYHWQ